jgi:ABC-type glycerol-3-phosphate transport system substrate-binding protein
VPEVLKTVEVDGKYYGVPTYFDGAPFLAYNTDMFKKAGIAKPPSKWSELLDACQKIVDAKISGVDYPFLFPLTSDPNDTELYVSLAYQNGGRWLSADGKTVTINTAGWRDTLQFYYDLVYKYKYSAQPTDIDYGTAGTLFFQNKTAMALGFSWYPYLALAFKAPPDFPYDMIPFPRPDKISGPNPSAGMLMDPTSCYYIVSTTKHPEEAWTFVKYVWEKGVKEGGWSPKNGIPGRTPVGPAQFEYIKDVIGMKGLYEAYKAGTLFEGAEPFPSFKGIDKMQNEYLRIAIQDVLLKKSDASGALDLAQKQCQSYLESL